MENTSKTESKSALWTMLMTNWQYLVIAVLTIIIVSRESLWYMHVHKMKSKISELNEFQETLLFRLQIDQMTQGSCESNITFNNSTSFIEQFDKQHVALQPLPAMYDCYGISIVLACVSVVTFENYYLHDVNSKMEHDAAFTQILHRVNDFVLRKHPITFVAVSLFILATVPWAWLGVFDRSVYVGILYKMVVAFSSASLLFFVGHNSRRLLNYLPRDRDEWRLKATDWTWWLWLASRVAGVYDLATATTTLLWAACLIWFSWPFRYFYYYRASVCYSATTGPGRVAVDVFLVNMIGHSALLVLFCFTLYLLVIVPPLPASGRDVPAGHNNATMRLWTNVHRLVGRHSSLVALLSVVSLLNSLVALLRVLWFVTLTSPCGFYAACVAWMFVHAHIGLSLFTVPVVNALVERQAVVGTYRSSFVDKFCEQQQQQRGSEGAAEDMGAIRDAASDLFDNVLALSVLYYVFVHPYAKEGAKSAAEKDGDPTSSAAASAEEEVRLGGVFQAMLQTELYAFAQSQSQDQQDDDEQEQQQEHEGASSSSSDGCSRDGVGAVPSTSGGLDDIDGDTPADTPAAAGNRGRVNEEAEMLF